MRIAINGFGRIGKTFLRVLLNDSLASRDIEVVAINCGPGNIDTLAYFFTYDTLMGKYPGTVVICDGYLCIDDKKIVLFAQAVPTAAMWKALSIDWVVDCSGKFTHRQDAQKHLDAGAKAVLISAPAHDEDVAIVPGVNDALFNRDKHTIVSLGSCTTNALMPMLKVLHESAGFQEGFMTTVHAYTNSQVLLDLDSRDNDPRKSRAAALNIIPTTTGAARMVRKIIPALDGKLQARALRVPVAKVSLVDISFKADMPLTVCTLNTMFKEAAESTLKRILAFTTEPLVSADFSGNPHSVIVDGTMTDAIGTMGHVFGWYDNEWGYSERLKDFLLSVR